MVPRVAMLTTAGETRFTMGANEGSGAGLREGGRESGFVRHRQASPPGRSCAAAAIAAAANLERRFMRSPSD